ncbi:MAG TPA: PEP-CTERM sorting domain-containing protein [Phycisphaerae bacterium]|nr:PEP-CTERM sorting domain-containing protein [Phycisphaerae bacterium]
MWRIPLLRIGLVCLLSVVVTVSAEPPSFAGLGDLPGGAFGSSAMGVSADGSVVVGASYSATGWSEAFRWQNGVMAGLGFLPDDDPNPFSGANAVSADGSVIAGSGSSSADRGNEPFRWEGGTLVSIGRIPGPWQNMHISTGISADGSRIVGFGEGTIGDRTQAWLWHDGTMMGLGTLTGQPDRPGAMSLAWGVSGDGAVVVGESESSDGYQAFRWSDGVMTGLGFLRASPFPSPDGDLYPLSYARAVSFDGSVIVGAGTSDASGPDGREAFRWVDGAMTGLGDLPGGAFFSDATAVSADGSVIVGQGATDASNVPFVWDSAHGMRGLQSVLTEELGLDLGGWTLTYAKGISADGTVIVGTGINPNGDNEAFRAVLPEPSVSLLVVLGGIVSIACGRRRK